MTFRITFVHRNDHVHVLTRGSVPGPDPGAGLNVDLHTLKSTVLLSSY